MCELYALTAKRKITVNDTLKTFYSHSEEHKNGWGIYLKDDSSEIIVKEYLKASDSTYLHALLDRNSRLSFASRTSEAPPSAR